MNGAEAPAPRGLWNRGFLSLLATQFFEAASDNIIKGVISFAVALNGPWETSFGEGGNGVVGLAFTLPFILLSAFGGRIADRSSKSRMTVVLKTVSLAVCVFCAFEFSRGAASGALAALVAFAIVSAFFGPVKYGMIAELVAPEKLARANGIINMATNVAVITGMVIAGIVAKRWKESFVDGAPTGTAAWLPGIAMAVFVVLGFLTCLTLPRLRAQKPDLPVDLNPFSTYLSTMREMARSPLLAVAGAWTFFYLIAAVVLLILPDYSTFLSVDDERTSLLMAGLAVSIGIGCVTAAYLDTPARRAAFVPAGTIGLAVAFALLGLAPANYWITLGLLVFTGLVAGFYIIPLQSMLQALAPDDMRGRVLGTANGLSFVMGAVGSGLFLALRHLGMPSNRIHLVLAGLCALMALVIWLYWARRRRLAAGIETKPRAGAA
jgi:acyl-[acyl-carrier-protein]-phospholipid O-acyltransferase/long-chain-fatty-acid--[acyl-carrier-protein] ligase